MLTKRQIAARIGPKKGIREYRDVVRANPPAYLCFCFDEDHLTWCDEFEGRRPCIHKVNEATEIFNRWLDGEINRTQLVNMLYQMQG